MATLSSLLKEPCSHAPISVALPLRERVVVFVLQSLASRSHLGLQSTHSNIETRKRKGDLRKLRPERVLVQQSGDNQEDDTSDTLHSGVILNLIAVAKGDLKPLRAIK